MCVCVWRGGGGGCGWGGGGGRASLGLYLLICRRRVWVVQMQMWACLFRPARPPAHTWKSSQKLCPLISRVVPVICSQLWLKNSRGLQQDVCCMCVCVCARARACIPWGMEMVMTLVDGWARKYVVADIWKQHKHTPPHTHTHTHAHIHARTHKAPSPSYHCCSLTFTSATPSLHRCMYEIVRVLCVCVVCMCCVHASVRKNN